METMNNVFSKICKWCGSARFQLPSGILVCDQCDYAVNKEGVRSVIPNRIKR